MDDWFRFLEFMSLKSRDRLSLTNLILLTLAIKVLCIGADIGTAIVFCACIANYCHKRFEITKLQAHHEQKVDADLASMTEKIKKIQDQHASVEKMADEAKKLLSQAHLATAFLPRGMKG